MAKPSPKLRQGETGLDKSYACCCRQSLIRRPIATSRLHPLCRLFSRAFGRSSKPIHYYLTNSLRFPPTPSELPISSFIYYYFTMAASRASSLRTLTKLTATQSRHLHMTGPSTFPSPMLTSERPAFNLPTDIAGLRAECQKRNLPVTGNRAEVPIVHLDLTNFGDGHADAYIANSSGIVSQPTNSSNPGASAPPSMPPTVLPLPLHPAIPRSPLASSTPAAP